MNDNGDVNAEGAERWALVRYIWHVEVLLCNTLVSSLQERFSTAG